MTRLCTAGFFNAMRRASNGTVPLDSEQRQALRHRFERPLWIIAGPGTGKTHTLVWLVLKRILVDGVAPDRLILTTFTRKAAVELQSRLIRCRQQLVDAGERAAAELDTSRIWVGTLHSICSRVLQDVRYEPTLRVRVLEDELTQRFFVRRSENPLRRKAEQGFWGRFAMAGRGQYGPTTAERCKNACKLFNRMTENEVDLDAIERSGDADLVELAAAYRHYVGKLREEHRTDQALLQRHFLELLETPAGAAWLGDGFTVVVDEYQDTNPIQERIYFKLAGERGDLTVVGDDDQSLYRFRGAAVEGLIDFDRICKKRLGRTPKAIYLRENRRSHPAIVAWVNRFIQHHPEMVDSMVRVRAPHKPPLIAKSGIRGEYPAVMAVVRRTAGLAGARVAELVEELKAEGLIRDYSQVALLSWSTRESTQSIGTYLNALRARGIPVYNPRSRTAQTDTRFRELVGALSHLLDAPGRFAEPFGQARLGNDLIRYVDEARAAYARLSSEGRYSELQKYVARSQRAIREHALDEGRRVQYLERQGGRQVTLSGLLFKLLSYEPFRSGLSDRTVGERLKALNGVLADYESLYEEGRLRVQGAGGAAAIEDRTLFNFYAVLVGGLHGGLDDPEDEEATVQEGAVNVMTIHQAKGLQFEAVVVLRPDKQPFVGDTHVLEDELDPFAKRVIPVCRRSRELRAAEDAVRLFYVAYSRAKRLLVLAGTDLPNWERVLGRSPAGGSLADAALLKEAGVCLI